MEVCKMGMSRREKLLCQEIWKFTSFSILSNCCVGLCLLVKMITETLDHFGSVKDGDEQEREATGSRNIGVHLSLHHYGN